MSSKIAMDSRCSTTTANSNGYPNPLCPSKDIDTCHEPSQSKTPAEKTKRIRKRKYPNKRHKNDKSAIAKARKLYDIHSKWSNSVKELDHQSQNYYHANVRKLGDCIKNCFGGNVESFIDSMAVDRSISREVWDKETFSCSKYTCRCNKQT